MRAVLQRVSRASVSIDGTEVGAIGRGLVALLGVERGDGPADRDYIVSKTCELRIFPDDEGRMNRSVVDVSGSVLVVSQFTLAGDARKGRRPSFDSAAAPAEARLLYEDVVRAIQASGLEVATGVFQAMMQVSLVNDGPVTILLDSRKQF